MLIANQKRSHQSTHPYWQEPPEHYTPVSETHKTPIAKTRRKCAPKHKSINYQLISDIIYIIHTPPLRPAGSLD